MLEMPVGRSHALPLLCGVCTFILLEMLGRCQLPNPHSGWAFSGQTDEGAALNGAGWSGLLFALGSALRGHLHQGFITFQQEEPSDF